jgi:2-deoxy-D-gluconate 3-dehydrogenase
METLPLNKLLDLSGKTAVVTGAVGIGYAIIQRLAEAGAKVMVAARNQEELNKTVAEMQEKNYQVKGVRADVSVEADVVNMVETTVAEFGGVDILVNNAGIFPVVPVMEMSTEDFEKVIDINLKGVFLCSKYAAAQMIKQGRGGRIINITSIDALRPSMVGLAHYDASKHGVWGFTKNLALELAPHKIWVNAVAPGGIATPGVAKMQSAPAGVDMKKILEEFINKIPMHRMGEPDDIGKVVLFLASEVASYMTGSQIVVDGGRLLM